jgi:hypothetical protein
MKTIIEQMEEHIIELLNKFSMRTDLHNDYIIDTETYKFRNDVAEEDKIWFYKFVCTELRIKLTDRIRIKRKLK